jgi:hypothetical protein
MHQKQATLVIGTPGVTVGTAMRQCRVDVTGNG